MVYRIAVSHTKHLSDADDVFQDVFLSLIKNMDKIDSEEHLKYWLIRTAINLSKNANMCFWRRKVTHELDDNMVNSGRCSNEFRDEIFDLREQIKALSGKQREVVYLHYYEGYSVKEIADILKISEGTVKSRLSSSRAYLRNNLEESTERG